ncbi:unnamed protein product [Heligmosomoides polygyrus]|uniref:60S ribosomal protein L28 n=1 Tax=Heligmosomoides polygyrus TaxID=6339 RepID=A0A183FAT9_HELPZ|nr:unnamed protein product [Heligmosomoides polygyrus]
MSSEICCSVRDTVNPFAKRSVDLGKSGRPAKSVRSITLRNTDKMLRSVKAIAKSQGMTPLYKLAQRRAAVIVRSQQPKSKKHAKKIEA